MLWCSFLGFLFFELLIHLTFPLAGWYLLCYSTAISFMKWFKCLGLIFREKVMVRCQRKKWKRNEGLKYAPLRLFSFPYLWNNNYKLITILGPVFYLQVVAKLHAILRPFLLRRMKSDVEQMLPRKKEIILYASLTEYQRNFQDHLLNKTLESYLQDRGDSGISDQLWVLILEAALRYWYSDILLLCWSINSKS